MIDGGWAFLRFSVFFQFAEHRIEVNIPSQAKLLDEVRTRFVRAQGFALATINLDHLVKLGRSAEFRSAYAAQDLVVADGNPIVWLSRLTGKPVDLMPGSDLVLPLCRLARDQGLPLAFVGSTDEALSGAGAALTARFAGLKLALTFAPAMGFDPEGPQARACLAELGTLGPALCFIALGAPKQEIFAALGRQIAPQMGFASVGAGLDFLSGHQTRAPQIVRKLALEWLWRALSSPRRMVPRYAACLAILPGQMLAALRQRRGNKL